MNTKAKVIIGIMGTLLTLFVSLFIFFMGFHYGAKSVFNNPGYAATLQQNQNRSAVSTGGPPATQHDNIFAPNYSAPNTTSSSTLNTASNTGPNNQAMQKDLEQTAKKMDDFINKAVNQ